jgi:DNA helicase II / ATP-dependent DNA helicase PcrA
LPNCHANPLGFIKPAADEGNFGFRASALFRISDFGLRPSASNPDLGNLLDLNAGAPMLNLSTLNPQQRMAVESIHGPVLILAGAGTGKTRVITCRIAHLIERSVSPGNILGVTFTNKAAREMQERVAKLVPRPARSGAPGAAAPQRPTLCTFHSLCVRILRQHIGLLGYKPNFVIYDESDQLGLMKKILARITDTQPGGKVDPGGVLSVLSRVKNGGAITAIHADANAKAMAQHVRPAYESALRACNAVDFDDLILLVLRLFGEHPQALEECRARYKYVMVDEYQDTNAAQFQLVQALTKEHRNLCVVGDDDQSIYGWRGAEVANLLEMEKYFPEVKVVKLEQNYRSTNTILNAANAIIKHNVRRRGKKLWSSNGDGSLITLHCFPDDETEAREIVEEIDFARKTRRVPWADQAILFRTNAQSRPLEMALRKAGVRYHLIGGQSFFDRREVRDFLAYLKTIVNPRDDISLLRIANVPARGLSEATMTGLLQASHERKCPVFEAMQNPVVTASLSAKARQCVESFAAFLERTREQATQTMVESSEAGQRLKAWGERFLDEIGYMEELRRSEKTEENAKNRMRNLQDLLGTMESRDESEPGGSSAPLLERLQTFLEQVSLDNDRGDKDEARGEAVTLITMHSCKGLEFPHVYIVGMEDGLLPHTRSKEEGTLDEERRLFYVALTRAKQTLAISHCLARKKYGAKTPCNPSPFLLELPSELTERADEKGKQRVSVADGQNIFAAMRSALD